MTSIILKIRNLPILLQGTEDTDAVNFKQLKDSSIIITDMKNKQIKNLSYGTDNYDAVNLNQVNNLIEQKFISNLDMGNKKIINLENGIYDQEAATVSQTRNLGGHKITSLARGTEYTDAVNHSQLTEIISLIDDCFKN